MPLALRFRSWQKKAGWLLAELVVVFVGVYAASLMADWRERRMLAGQREQIHQMLTDEVAFAGPSFESAAERFDSVYVAPFERAYERGERPTPRPIDLTVGNPISKDLWDAMLATGGLEAVDHETLRLAQLYFTAQGSVLKWADEFRARSDALIVPRLAEGPGAFYRSDTTVLAEPFEWYPRSMRQFRDGLSGVGVLGDSLRRHLDGLDP
jgi:hypothetical protein